jgi:hypothetical protein
MGCERELGPGSNPRLGVKEVMATRRAKLRMLNSVALVMAAREIA